MKIAKHILVLFISLFFLFSLYCTSSSDTQYDKENLMNTISELDKAWDNADVEKIVEMYTDDLTFLEPEQEMIRGKEAFTKHLQSNGSFKVQFTRDKIDIQIEGNLAYEIVNQNAVVTVESQEPVKYLQKYVHIWKRQENGSWKVIVDMYNLRN